MALDATKWRINLDKSIEYIGGDHGTATANYVTVLELHRWLQDLADGASISADDYMDITSLSPSDKSFDTIINLVNGYYLDEIGATPAVEFVYGGSIIQNNGGGEQIFDGIKVVANRGTVVNVIQNGAVLTNKFWNSTPSGESFAGINPDPANGVCMQFMVKVKDAGVEIDNTSVIFTTREWGKTFAEFRIPATGRGENTVPLQYTDDLNNATAQGTVAGWSANFSNSTAGYNTIDLNQGDGLKGYYSAWDYDTGARSINDFYEYMKNLTRNGETGTLYGLAGELFRGITHSISVQAAPSPGAWTEGAPISWGTGPTAGTGQLLAYDTANDVAHIQLLTGVVPADSMTLTDSTNTATTIASNSVAEQAVSAPFCGASTGSSIVGAFGFGIVYADLSTNDKLKALDGITRNPPNNVTFTVNGVQSGYRVLVGPATGSNLAYDQLSLASTLNTDGGGTVSFVENRPANTPDSGTLRIQRDDGRYSLHNYTITQNSPMIMTIDNDSFLGDAAAAGNNAFISYIDAVAGGTSINFNTVQTTNQTLFIEARFAGTGPTYSDAIKPARSTGTLGGTGGSATLSPVSDA